MIKNDNKNPGFLCDCGKVYKHQSGLSRHMKICKNGNNDNKMIKNDNKNPGFSCDCGKVYKHQSGLSRHMKICKNSKNDNKMVKKDNNIPEFSCDCGKVYKHRSGLSRHLSKCNFSENVNKNLNSNVVEILKDISADISNAVKTMTDVNSTTNINNNTINSVNVFLNDKCMDAMSIQEFGRQFKFNVEDLMMNKATGLTNMILKNVRPLCVTERPFHCINVENKHFQVKDETDGWTKDNGEKIIKNAEHALIKEGPLHFQMTHPTWSLDETLTNDFVKVSNTVTGYLSSKEEARVLKNVGHEVTLKQLL